MRNKIDVTSVAFGNTLAVQVALHQKSKESAEGAQCESQGQARASEARRPWVAIQRERLRPVGPKYHWYYALLKATRKFNNVTRGDALRFARACPWLSYLRAFGALFRLLCKASASLNFSTD